MNRLRTGYTCSKEQRKKWGRSGAGSREHGSHVAMLVPRTPLHLGRPSRVQRYSSGMHRAMEEDSLMTRYDDDDSITTHQTDRACLWLVCHSRGDCANLIHLPRLYGGPATQFLGEVSRASSQHGWRSAYSLRETLSPIQDQNQH